MGSLLNSGEVGNIQTKALQEQRELIVSRWNKTPLLEGLQGQQRSNLAQLLENQAGQLVQESIGTPANMTTNAAGFDVVAFPMVRRVFANLLANEIVSVQPMNLPSGLLFYIDHQVSSTHPTDGSTAAAAYSGVYDTHYDNGGYENAFGTDTAHTSTAVSVASGDTSETFAYTATNHEQSLASLSLWCGSTEYAKGTFRIGEQTWTEDAIDDTITVHFTPLNQNAAAANHTIKWNEYATLEGDAKMNEVKLVVTSVTVQATTRKLKAVWTPELAQDLAAYHSLDAEAELTALLSEEVAAEIDREIIRDLIHVAPYRTTWDYSLANATYSGFQTQKVHNQSLVTEINRVSAKIHKETLRGGANWIVCSSEISAILEDLDTFKAPNVSDEMQFNMGIESVGQIGSRYKVYKDPYMPANICLMGHKGSSFLEAGYVYAPYIPFQITPVMYDADDFTPRKGIMTRYGKKVVNNKFYGLVYVSNISTIS